MQDRDALVAQARQLEAEGLKALEGRRDLRQALRLHEELARVAQALNDSELLYKALRRSGDVTSAQGALPQSLEFYRRAQEVARANGMLENEASALLAQSLILASQGKKSRSLETLQQGERLANRSASKRAIGEFLDAASYAYGAIGEYDQGLKCLERSERIRRELNDLRGLATTYNLRNYLYRTSHQFARALEVSLATLALRQQLNDAREEMVEYSNIAQLYHSLGEPDKALSYLLRGLQERNREGTGYLTAQLLGEASEIYHLQGQRERALHYSQQAVEAYEKAGVVSLRANLLTNQSQLLVELGRVEEALATLKQTLKLVRDSGNGRVEGQTLVQLGSIYARRGDIAQARSCYERALQVQRTSGERLGEASTLLSFADLDSSRIDFARRCYHQALAIYRDYDNRLGTALALAQLADLERRALHSAAAESAYRQSIALSESLRADAGNGISAQGTFFEMLSGAYHGYLTLLVEQGRAAEAFSLAQRTKARRLLDLMLGGKVDLSRQLTESERVEERQRRERCDALAAEMVREAALNVPGSKKRFEQKKQELTAAERELVVFQDALYARYPGLGQRRATVTVTLKQLGAFLPHDSALLEFASLEDGRMAVFVVTRDRAGKPRVSAHRLALASGELERRVAALRAACTNPKAAWKSEASALYRILIAPVERYLTGKTELVLCPDRVLWDVPFAVLTDRRGSTLLSRFSLSYASSATAWHASQGTARRPSAPSELLVLANPQFDAEKRFESGPSVPGQRPITVPDRPITVPDRPITVPDRPITVPDRDLLVPRGTRLVDLPGTQREADALVRRFPGAAIYTRGMAQESVVKKIAPKFRRVHLASHAFVNDVTPLLSSIVLANPLPGSGDDGFLTAREIFDLDLSGVELVTLSACGTARGKTQAGEGVVGLTWALFAAGCPTQVLSQWAVDDASTAMLMTRFYDGLARGVPKAPALRQAALDLRKSSRYAHPYFWAAFVLIGNPR